MRSTALTDFRKGVLNYLKSNNTIQDGLFEKIFKLEKSQSSIRSLFNKFPENIKFTTGLDRVFIISNKKFYIFASSELLSRKNDIDSNIAEKKILQETLDFFYVNESQIIILYGKSEMNANKNCIAVYDFIKNLILFTIFLPAAINDHPQIIRGKINKNHTLSYIALSYKERILIYKGPFTSKKISPSIDISFKPITKIILLEFGKIETKIDSEKIQSTRDVLYILTESPSNEGHQKVRLRILFIDDNNLDLNPNLNYDDFIIIYNFEIVEKCILLDYDTFCFDVKTKDGIKHQLVFSKLCVKNGEIVKDLILEQDIASTNLTFLFGFKHYIFTFDKQKFCIYDYKYIADLTKENYASINQQIGQIDYKDSYSKKLINSIKCLFECDIDLSLFIFHHLSKAFLFFYDKKKDFELLELYEEEPSTIISNLITPNDHFEYAKQQAEIFSMSPAEIADIEWKQANFIYNNAQYDEITRTERAMDHFIKTIGYYSSSNVIHLYMNYKEETLIRYLWGDDFEHYEPSKERLIMNPKTGSLEHRKLLILICVNLYLEIKKKQGIDESKNCAPIEILNKFLEKIDDFNDCSESLIDAFLAVDLPKKAIDTAEKTNNYERRLKLLFDLKDDKKKDNKNIEKIIDVIFNSELNDDQIMKYLNQYARELFYVDTDIGQITKLIAKISKFAKKLIENKNSDYIQRICLLFVPQLSAVSPDIKLIQPYKNKEDSSKDSQKNSTRKIVRSFQMKGNDPYMSNHDNDNNNDNDENDKKLEKIPPENKLLNEFYKYDQTRMSIMFYVFFQEVLKDVTLQEKFSKVNASEEDNNASEKDSNIVKSIVTLNNVYIQHLIILCRNIKSEKIFHPELKNALENYKYDIDVTILSIIDLPEEYLKFELLNCICLKHEEYASKLIHLVPLFKDMEDRIASSIIELCKQFGAKNPNLYIEAISELIRKDKYAEAIPLLLEEASKFIPLPDIITYILQLPTESLGNRKLNISLIKKYVVDWMTSMKKYEDELKKEIEKNEKELKEVANKEYSLKEMKEIRDDYEKMINYAKDNSSISPPSTSSIPDLVPKRPFSIIPINFNTLEEPTEDSNRGTKMPSSLLDKLEKGALVYGLDKSDINTKNRFIADQNKMIADFDQMFDYLNQ